MRGSFDISVSFRRGAGARASVRTDVRPVDLRSEAPCLDAYNIGRRRPPHKAHQKAPHKAHQKALQKALSGRGAAALLSLLALAGCGGQSEGAVRDLAAQWFDLGETRYFKSSMGCTAALFNLESTKVHPSLPREAGPGEALARGKRHGLVALDDPATSPDQGFVDIMNIKRPIGAAIQKAGLEGRDCMDDLTQSGFHYAMSEPAAMLVFHQQTGLLLLADPQRRILVVAGGEG